MLSESPKSSLDMLMTYKYVIVNTYIMLLQVKHAKSIQQWVYGLQRVRAFFIC